MDRIKLTNEEAVALLRSDRYQQATKSLADGFLPLATHFGIDQVSSWLAAVEITVISALLDFDHEVVGNRLNELDEIDEAHEAALIEDAHREALLEDAGRSLVA
jgi:hypothetical protein